MADVSDDGSYLPCSSRRCWLAYDEENSADKSFDEGSSVNPIPSSGINILLIGANARVVELHLQKPRVAGLDRNYEVCYNLRTFSCKDYVYHFANASPAYSGELDRHNILKVADSCLTDALFISNTTILVLSADVGDEAKIRNSVEKFVVCSWRFRHKVIILVNRMDSSITESNPNWDEARFNHVKTEAIAAAPLLSKMPVKWIPVNVSEKTEENIHVGSAKCPWFEGGTLAEYLHQLAEDNLKNQDPETDYPCCFSVYQTSRFEGFPNLSRVVGHLVSGRMEVDGTYEYLPDETKVKVVLMTSAGNKISTARTGEILELLLYTENYLLEVESGGVINDIVEDPLITVKIFEAMINLVDDFDPFSWPIRIQIDGFVTPAYILDMRFKKGGAAREPRAGSKVRASIALKTCYLGTSLNFFVIKTGASLKGVGKIISINKYQGPTGTKMSNDLWSNNALQDARFIDLMNKYLEKDLDHV